MQEIENLQRHPSPVATPQALAWSGQELYLSSRDAGTFGRVDTEAWKIAEELNPPGVVWAAVATNDGWRLTIGEDAQDDRYIYRHRAGSGFEKLFACPDFTGSYLSFDGEHLYLSQWYKGLILQLDEAGKTVREIQAGAEICGHTFVNGALHVLRGQENEGVAEEWRIARLDLATGDAEDLAAIPFAARSLTHDGARFWSNHRAANETISFTLPATK